MKKCLLVIFVLILCGGCAKETPTFPIEQDTCFMYEKEQLNKELKEDYDTMYEAVMDVKESVKLKSDDEGEIEEIYNAIRADHPEIFWLNDFNMFGLSIEDFGNYSTLHFSYQYTNEEVETYKAQLEEKTLEIVNGIPEDAQDFDKVKYMYDYVIDSTTYKRWSNDNQNILSVLLYNKSVCAGYAKTMQYLLNKVDVNCHYLTGETTDQRGLHAWNMVEMDGEYYYVDATFGDPVNEDGSSMKTYAYLGMTSSEMESLYVADTEYEPTSAMNDNYYVKTGSYVDSLNSTQFINLLQTASNGDHTISVKCSDADMYALYKAHMLDNNYIFTYLSQLGIDITDVSYTEYENLNVIEITF